MNKGVVMIIVIITIFLISILIYAQIIKKEVSLKMTNSLIITSPAFQPNTEIPWLSDKPRFHY